MELHARIVTLEYLEPFVISRSADTHSRVVQVAISHDGLVGYGEGAPDEHYDEGPDTAHAWILEHVGPLLGDDPLATGAILDRLSKAPEIEAAGITTALPATTDSGSTPFACSSALSARRASPRPDWRELTQARAKAASSTRVASRGSVSRTDRVPMGHLLVTAGWLRPTGRKRTETGLATPSTVN